MTETTEPERTPEEHAERAPSLAMPLAMPLAAWLAWLAALLVPQTPTSGVGAFFGIFPDDDDTEKVETP